MELKLPFAKLQPTLQDSDLDQTLTHCIVCNSRHFEDAGLTVQDQPLVKYLSCQTCHVKFVDRQPTRLFLSGYYRPDNYLGSVASNERNALRFARRILSKSVRESLGSLTHAPRILDFGGGTGRLGIAVRSSLGRPDSTSIVMDVHPPLQALDTKFVPSDHLSSYQNEQFDLVLASAVIEHLKRPGEVLQSLYESCAEYGFLYFRIPSNFPLGKLSKRLMLFPEHLSHLGPRFWDVIPKLLGWSVKLEYSRPSIADAPFTANPIAALGSAIFKLPANVEVSIRQLLRNPSVARYECAGGWEVMYQRVAPASRSLNRESTR